MRRLHLFLRDGLAQVVYLVFEGPFWNGTVDERPGRPSVYLVFPVLCCVVNEMGCEVESVICAKDADEVGVFSEFGVESGGDEDTLHCFGMFIPPSRRVRYDVIDCLLLTKIMESLPVDMANPQVQDFLSLVRFVLYRI